MSNFEVDFQINRIAFDEDYAPAEGTRLTTNFANLARGEYRRENLQNALTMINNRFNALASWDNPSQNRYALKIDIISVNMKIKASDSENHFPIIEMLHTHIQDQKTGELHQGLVGNNFSSYVRDYDFSVLFPKYMKEQGHLADDFGDLHGRIFKSLLLSEIFNQNFAKRPVICISVSTKATYSRTQNHHPVLGVEYEQDAWSETDKYFAKMGMKARYFMPKGSVAPLAFYHFGNITRDYTDFELISTISTMESFQKIYRPEIYNANSAAPIIYNPSLTAQDFSVTQVVYDRVERSALAKEQGHYAGQCLIIPYGQQIQNWLRNQPLQTTF